MQRNSIKCSVTVSLELTLGTEALSFLVEEMSGKVVLKTKDFTWANPISPLIKVSIVPWAGEEMNIIVIGSEVLFIAMNMVSR